MSKTVWVINQYVCTPRDGNPGRSFFMGKILAQHGYFTRMIGANFSHLHRFKRHKPRHETIINNCEMTWLPVLPYRRTQSPIRMLNWFLFAFQLIFLTPKQTKPDFIIYSSPSPVGYLGCYVLSKRHGAKLIFDVRDIWPLSLTKLGNYRSNNPLIKILEIIENFACRKSDLVISSLPGYEDYLSDKNVMIKRFLWVKNGIEINSEHPKNNTLSLSMPTKKNNFIIGYVGSLGLANNLDILIDAAKLLEDNKNIHFVLIGAGNKIENLQMKILQAGVSRVTILPPVMKESVMTYLRSFDLCYIGWHDSDLYEYGIAANKIPEYMASGVPIVQSYSGRHNPVDIYNCGWTVPANDPESLAEKISHIYNMTDMQRAKVGKAGMMAAKKHYNYEEIVNKLKEELKAL